MTKNIGRILFGAAFALGFSVLAFQPLRADASDGNLGFNVTYTKSAIAWNYIDASTASIMQGDWLNLKLNTTWNLSSGCWPGASEPTCSPPSSLAAANMTVIWKQASCPAGVTCYWYSRDQDNPMKMTWGIVANVNYSPGIQISNTASLAPGTYPIDFSVEEHPESCRQSGGACIGKKTFRVNLVVQGPAPKPSISAIPASVNFSAVAGGPAPASNSLTLKNTGTGTLNWTAAVSQNWCHLNSTSGSLAPNATSALTLWVDAPSNVGTFNCTVTFSDPNSSNGSQSVAVTYAVANTPPPPPPGNPGAPVLTSLNPSQATLSQVQGQMTIDVFGSQFDPVLSNNLPLYTRDADGQTTGIAVAGTISGGLRVNVPANLLAGTYTFQILNGRDFVNLRSNGLKFTVLPDSPKANIILSPTSLNFSATLGQPAPATQALVIRNTGNADLNWSASANQNWCHLSPASGSLAPGGSATATIRVDAPSNVGSFNCTINVAAPNSTNSPQTSSVNYQVSASPEISVCGFTNTGFRYMKFENVYPVAWAAWKELEFYDTAGSKLTPTIIGGSADWVYPSQGAYGKRAAIDADIYTQWNGADAGWVTPFSPPINIVFDFGRTVNLGRMRFLPQNTIARDVNIWVGNDSGNISTLLKKIQGNYFEAVWVDFNCLSGNRLLSTFPTSLSFSATIGGQAPAAKSVNVYNTGALTLAWNAATNQNWCRVSPSTGSLAGGGTTSVSVSVDAPSNAGTFDCVVVFSSPLSVSQTLAVAYTVDQSNPANISLNPGTFNFAAVAGSPAPVGQPLTIRNTGTGVLNWYATVSQNWCHVEPASGMVSPGSSAVTSVTVDRPSNIGSYDCTVVVSGPNTSSGPQTAGVAYNVTAPLSATIGLSGYSYAFNGVINGPAPSPQNLVIRNSGQAALNWSATANQSWCKISPATGSLLPSASANVSVSVNAPFGAGNFNCVINVSAANTTNSPQTINVTYGVSSTPRPIISMSPTSFPFQASSGGGAPSPQTMILRNVGNANLAWAATTSQSWCRLSPASGNLAPNNSSNVSVSVDQPSNTGTFNCSVTVYQVGNLSNAQQAAVTYRVDTAGVSNPSKVVAASPVCGVVTVTWQAGRNATAYALYRNTSNILPPAAYRNSLSSTSFVDENVSLGTKYFYWVQSIGSAGATPADSNIFQGAAPSACEADLTPSDKNLKAINNATQPHNDCDYNKFQGAPQNKTLKDGDILTFDINLCNLTGTADATEVKITDKLLNLSMPVSGFNATMDGQPLRYVSGSPQAGEYAYNASEYELIFNVGSVAANSARQISYDALVKTQGSGFTGCVKCQSQTVISFKKDLVQPLQEIDLYTPPIFYSVSKP